MAPSTRGDDEIYDLAEQCARLFKDAKAILSGRPGNQFLVVLEYEQRFQQWAADFGVFAEPRVPIDARLGRRRGLRQVILELLQMLEVNLGRVVYFESQAVDEEPKVASVQSWLVSILQQSFELFKSASRTGVQPAELAPATLACLKAIQKAIGRLKDLTALLAPPSPEASESSPEDDGSDVSADLQRPIPTPASMRLHIGGIVNSRFPKIDRTLAERLEASIQDRRRRLQRKRSKLPRADLQPDLPSGPVQVRDVPSSADGSANEVALRGIDDMPEADEATEDKFYLKQPKAKGGTPTYRCSWCHEELQFATLDEGTWRKHRLADLRPYVCLGSCREPAPSFVTFQEWREHMDTEHTPSWVLEINSRTKWYCDLNPSKRETFSSPVELSHHIESAHKGKIPRVEIAAMIANNVVVSPGDPETCPLCQGSIIAVHEGVMAEHVALHLRSLAWLSIRYLDVVLPSASQDQEGKLKSDDSHLAKYGSLTYLDDLSATKYAGAQFSAESDGENREAAYDRPLLLTAPRPSAVSNPERSPTAEKFPEAVATLEGGSSSGARAHKASYNPGYAKLSPPSSAYEQLLPTNKSGVDRRHSTTPMKRRDSLPTASSGHDTLPQPIPRGSGTAPEPKGLPALDSLPDRAGSSTRMTSRTLGLSIQKSLVESKFDAQLFLPRGRIDTLITRATIEEVLQLSRDDPEARDIVDFVSREARILFAIMVSIRADLPLAVTTAYRFGLTDKILPVSMEAIDDIFDGRAREHPAALEAFLHEPWDYLMLSDFFERQWRFLAPVFSTNSFDTFELHSRRILPFDDLGTHRRSSLFSDVYEVKVHPDHISGNLGRGGRMAVKELRSREDLSEEFDLEESFKVETSALKEVSALHHTNLVSAIAVMERGNKRYFMFPWADGGNLREFWGEYDVWPLAPNLIGEVLTQLLGLSDALANIHRLSWRHGDVKPENILRFDDHKTLLGNLRLGDMGLAKKHETATRMRHHATDTKVGTLRYEPPEAVIPRDAPRSRRYDIWSMGCLMLEFIIWLQYGREGLEEFNSALNSEPTSSASFYSVRKKKNGEMEVRLHAAVQSWLEYMGHDPDWPRGTALGDLVHLVQSRMLVVMPSPSHPSEASSSNAYSSKTRPADKRFIPWLQDPEGVVPSAAGNSDGEANGRADSDTLLAEMSQICLRSRAESTYLYPEAAQQRQRRRDPPRPPRNLQRTNSLLEAAGPSSHAALKQLVIPNAHGYRARDPNAWDFQVDNAFAVSFAKSSSDLELPTSTKFPQVCDICSRLDVCVPRFAATYEVSYLEENTATGRCGLCALFYNAAAGSGVPLLSTVTFRRAGSVLVVNEGPPVLSIIAELNTARSSSETLPPDIQLSYPSLPGPGSITSANLMRHWVRSCDTAHRCMSVTTESELPRRLLSTNYQAKGGLRLCTTDKMDPRVRYTTLSYVWGKVNIERTTQKSLPRFERGIDYKVLPKTFRDAIEVTHELGVQYIWIDSMCILWDVEEERTEGLAQMGTIFSGAYCVLVASSALDITEGLLMPRRQRLAIPLQKFHGVPILVCELIDDFQSDVDAAPHSTRGWAFQERVLARRTIFFTSTQMYWQCGEGIQCETLMRLQNIVADIIGSPEFPKSALEKGIPPVQIFRAVYERYSRLQFNVAADRAPAVMALEARLLRSFETPGRYGVMQKFLGQSLLWRRSSDDTLERIQFRSNAPPVPSWSWMAYTGGINYFDVPSDVDWDLHMEWFGESVAPSTGTGSQIPHYPRLEAYARGFNKHQITNIFYDVVGNAQREDQECVVVAASRKHGSAFYLLIVAPREGSHGKWDRLGIAYAEDTGLVSFSPTGHRIDIY